jgi:hypothetical protein
VRSAHRRKPTSFDLEDLAGTLGDVPRSLSKRNRETLRAMARVLIPPGGQVPPGADDLDIAGQIADAIDTWSPGVRREVGWMLRAIEWLPVPRHRRRFSKLKPERQHAFLEANYHSPRTARRFMVSSIKQLCFAVYLSQRQVEAVVGYRYECLRPRDGMDAAPAQQVHH